jgi:hypothetical protein
MKLTTKILSFILLLIIAGLISSNMILKKQYDAIDKSDVYWTYNKVLEQPFKHLYITGGNDTHIFYEQSEKSSVRLLQEWVSDRHGEVKASIKHDTLFLTFDYVPANPYEKYILENSAPVRIFSPELLSVTGKDINFEMHRLRQKNITANIMGKSQFEVETLDPEMDSVVVNQSDSSAVKFEISPDYRKKTSDHAQKGRIAFHNADGVLVTVKGQQQESNFDEGMSIHFVRATIKDHSILDVGHAQVKNLQIKVSDSAAIVLSGDSLKKVSSIW